MTSYYQQVCVDCFNGLLKTEWETNKQTNNKINKEKVKT